MKTTCGFHETIFDFTKNGVLSFDRKTAKKKTKKKNHEIENNRMYFEKNIKLFHLTDNREIENYNFDFKKKMCFCNLKENPETPGNS